jgi:hypothetical protein
VGKRRIKEDDELFNAGGVYRPTPRKSIRVVTPSAVIKADGKPLFIDRSTRKRPLAMQGPMISVRLQPLGSHDWVEKNAVASMKRFERLHTPRTRALTLYQSRDLALGSFWSDLWDRIKRIVNAIYETIKGIINLIIKGLKKVFEAVRWLIGQILKIPGLLLSFVEWFPFTRWLYLGIDHLTGGALTSLKALLNITAKFTLGEHISREEVMVAMKIVGPLVTIAVGVITGGIALAAISAGAMVLKNGPIGKTAIGRFLLDVVAVGAGMLLVGSSISNAFMKAGEDLAIKAGKNAIADATGIPVDVLDVLTGNIQSVADIQSKVTSFVEGGWATTDYGAVIKQVTTATSLLPEPARIAAGATYAVTEAAPGTEISSLDKFAYTTLDDKSPIASAAYSTVKDPSQVTAALESGVNKAVDVASDPTGAVSAAGNAIVTGATAAAEAVPSITSIKPPTSLEIKAPSFPGMPDIDVDPKEATDFVLSLLSKKSPAQASQVTQIIEEYQLAPVDTTLRVASLKSTGMVKAAAGIIVGLTILGTMLMDSKKKGKR